MARPRIIAPEHKIPEANLKRDYFYRNMTIKCLEEGLPYQQTLWSVKKLNLVTKEAVDEYWEEGELALLKRKQPILEANGYTYRLEKVTK